jgi:hypothetical protein
MDIAPIRSPLDMQRAEMRMAILAAVERGVVEELEYGALQDAIEHYRCVTDRPRAHVKAEGTGRAAIEV